MRKGLGAALRGSALLAVAALLAIVTYGDAVRGQAGVKFGIRPAQAGADDPAEGAYFRYILEPGATVSDEAMVINNGQEQVALKLYPADGVTAIGGGTAFAAAEEVRSGVRSWLSADVSELELGAGDSTTVPFTVQVPADAAPGDHVAGWVVEGPPKAGEDQGIGTAVIERVGVAVVVRVPGPTQERLTLGAMCLNQESGSNYFQVPVANEGSVLTRGSGTFSLTTEDGQEVFAWPVELGTVLPRDDTLLRVDAPLDPGPGSYVAAMALRQPNGEEVQTRSEINISEEKVNGCLIVAGPQAQPPADAGGSLSLPGDDIPWLVILLASLGVLLATLLVVREVIWRRRQKRGESDP